ncbi:MAG: LytTR family DNA-binding domain-containing protein [Acetatifactor sp.]|nr:LytTR family DNA-binding domain-containing protein [Acetatifactor sp.]
MFNIAIVDDEDYFRNDLKELVQNYMIEKGYALQIDTFQSGEEFISLGIGMFKYNIVFLDINMDKVDGVSVAKKIRAINKGVFIVFVTVNVEYVFEGYELDITRYLLKDNSNLESSIIECLDAIIQKINYVVVKKMFKFNETEKQISLDRLLYIESRLHKLEFHVMEESMKLYTMYETLNVIEKQLENFGFIRIHQSYLVNKKYIIDVLRYKAILSNGDELIIPKVRYKEVRDAFIEYQGEV